MSNPIGNKTLTNDKRKNYDGIASTRRQQADLPTLEIVPEAAEEAIDNPDINDDSFATPGPSSRTVGGRMRERGSSWADSFMRDLLATPPPSASHPPSTPAGRPLSPWPAPYLDCPFCKSKFFFSRLTNVFSVLCVIIFFKQKQCWENMSISYIKVLRTVCPTTFFECPFCSNKLKTIFKKAKKFHWGLFNNLLL